MEKLTTSLCITVKNEEKTISNLLDSVYSGSKIPDEIVVVDGGSTDNTLNILQSYSKKYKNLKIFVKKGNIAVGRNESIGKASGEIIVITDAGCVVEKDWFNRITSPFKKNTDIVAGYYTMPSKSPLQAALNVFHGVTLVNFNHKNFLPSARSSAFRKAVWKKIGGFNERLGAAGEDTLFFADSVKNNFKIERVGEARVVWQETYESGLLKIMNKFYNYAKSDVKTGIWYHPLYKLMSHNIRVFVKLMIYTFISIYYIYLAKNNLSVLPAFLIFVIYIFSPVLKYRNEIKDWRVRMWLPIVKFFSDLAIMAGFISGILELRRQI